MSERAPQRSWLTALPYRVLVEISSLVAARPKMWASTARKVAGALLLLVLVDLNSTHVGEMVRGLVRSWREAQTQSKLGAIAAALDAEFASFSRYPSPDTFPAFVRSWVEGQGDDPATDSWGAPISLHVNGVGYELRSCGHDGACGTADDIRYVGGP